MDWSSVVLNNGCDDRLHRHLRLLIGRQEHFADVAAVLSELRYAGKHFNAP